MPAVRRFVAASLCACACAAGAAEWQPVPGAPDLSVDTTSLQQERSQVAAWIRWWGRAPLGAAPAPTARVHRTVLRTAFDCSRRTVRVLAAHAYDSRGAAVFMSSVPGPEQPVRGEELTWAYDAVCEAARAGGRF